MKALSKLEKSNFELDGGDRKTKASEPKVKGDAKTYGMIEYVLD